MSRYNRSIILTPVDKRVLAVARQTPECAPLFEAGGMDGIKPKAIGKMVQAITERLNEPMDDVCHGLAKLSASGRFAQ